MTDDDNLIAKVPLSWKKSFSQGVKELLFLTR